MDMNIKGQHAHTPSTLDLNVELSYAKDQKVGANLMLRDKSDKLTKMNGALTLDGFGSDIVLRSDLSQASKKQVTSHKISFNN